MTGSCSILISTPFLFGFTTLPDQVLMVSAGTPHLSGVTVSAIAETAFLEPGHTALTEGAPTLITRTVGLGTEVAVRVIVGWIWSSPPDAPLAINQQISYTAVATMSDATTESDSSGPFPLLSNSPLLGGGGLTPAEQAELDEILAAVRQSFTNMP